MPPKGADAAEKARKKAEAAAKQKKAEDKTFGLKNKNKSAKVQQYVQQVTKNATQTGKQNDRLALLDPNSKEAKAKKKADEEARQRELAELFTATIKQPKVPTGVDPKSIVCEFFKKGACAKGFKCKFSHDLAVERKTQKIDLFSDRRDGENDTMENWDQDQLERAIQEKEAKGNLNRPTDIICKYFLEAIEKKQYGWFWVCPNGGQECKYRHALPPGYVLKSQIKALAAEEAANRKTVEEEIEEARAGIEGATPVTEAVFKEWKRRKVEQKAAKEAEARAERIRTGRVTGRELTELGNFTFEDDDLAGDSSDYVREVDMEAQFRQAEQDALSNLAAAKANQGSDEAGPSGTAGVAGLSAALAAELEDLGEDELGDDDDDEDIDFGEEGEGGEGGGDDDDGDDDG